MKKLIPLYLVLFALNSCKEDSRQNVSPQLQVTHEEIVREVILLLAKNDLKQVDPKKQVSAPSDNSEKIQLFKADFDKLVSKIPTPARACLQSCAKTRSECKDGLHQ